MVQFTGKVDSRGRVSIPLLDREVEHIRPGDIVEVRIRKAQAGEQ